MYTSPFSRPVAFFNFNIVSPLIEFLRPRMLHLNVCNLKKGNH